VTILPSGPLTVNVVRRGGLLGRTVESATVAAPSSPLHDAAVALLGLDPATSSSTRSRDAFSRDAFTYVVRISADDEELLVAQFHDPVPDELGVLLTALADHPSV
jgi:hypothetical protein